MGSCLELNRARGRNFTEERLLGRYYVIPYIKPSLRPEAWLRPEGAGPLCYALCKQIDDYRVRQGDSFATYAEVLAALETAKLEFYVRIMRPYEQKKCEANGDVFSLLGGI